MKHKALFLAATPLLLASCAAHYVATDTVDRHLDGTRQIMTPSQLKFNHEGWDTDTLATPLIFDFRSDKDTMRYAYMINISRGGWTLQMDSVSRWLQPEVTVSKRFRWFTTRYRYTARFPQLDSLPVPIGDYLSPEEQQLMFSPNELPDDWTGTDLYSLLDKLNTKYVQWWDHCLFEKEMAAYATCCDSTQLALLEQYHDTLLAIILADLPDSRKSFDHACQQFPELSFVGDITQDHFGVSYAVFHWSEDRWDLNTRVIWRTQLPGDHLTEHMVSADRMILGDYTIEEQSFTINYWACILTLLLLALGTILLARRK